MRAGSVTLSSNKTSVNVGENFTVSVNISNMSVATLTAIINVDTSKVDYVSVNYIVAPGNSNFSGGRVICNWTDPGGGATPLTGGTIATFTFKSKVEGSANFSVSGDFYDSGENDIAPDFLRNNSSNDNASCATRSGTNTTKHSRNSKYGAANNSRSTIFKF